MRDGIRIISAAANSGSEEGGLRLRALEAAPGAEAVAQETQFGKASGTGDPLHQENGRQFCVET